MIPCCALSATSEVAWVLTTIPSATVSVQEACGLGIPRPLPASGTSTRHCRQAPTGASSGWSQKRGICTPICSAARITRVFLGTETSTPSMVTVTSSDLSGAFSSDFFTPPVELVETVMPSPPPSRRSRTPPGRTGSLRG